MHWHGLAIMTPSHPLVPTQAKHATPASSRLLLGAV